ncbi:MAG: asparagine synthase (glutamine-hydrolyzing) [Geminicoccaceae bacterium]
MCGFAGLVRLTPTEDAATSETLVERMSERIAHRGPDDHGLETRGTVCLSARRLSIIDLSSAGRMPMHDESGRWAIVYNGEVYNFQELRQELSELNHRFRSRTDTEVVLHAFIEWGLDCMQRFVGMFAFAIHDRDTDTITLVRDRFGIKPLYYARTDRFIMFASEVKALLVALDRPKVDQRSLLEWFLYGNVDVLTPDTLIEGVSAVLPGEAVTIQNGVITTHQWYAPLHHVDRAHYARFAAARPEAVVDEIEQTLEEATRLRLISDVPVGTLLSGGLDSSLITAMAARHSTDLSAFHVSVAGHPDLDERRFAELLARKLEIPFIPLELNGENFRGALSLVTDLSDMPLSHPNSIAYYLISKIARDHGVIVLLSGEGADELFGGYHWAYRRVLWLHRLLPFLRWLPRRLHELAQLFVYAHAGMPVTAHRFRDLLPPTVAMLDRGTRQAWREQCSAYAFVDGSERRAVLGSMAADLSDFLTPLLRRLDRTSMGASVECRVPFLDHRLVHKAINLPMDYRVGARANKWILKRIADAYLPTKLIHRNKMGFPVPLADYVRPLASTAFFAGGFCEQELGLHPLGLERLLADWQRWVYFFFGLVTLEIWGRIHLRRESIETIDEQIRKLERDSGTRGP